MNGKNSCVLQTTWDSWAKYIKISFGNKDKNTFELESSIPENTSI